MRFVVFPGDVWSVHDGDRHFISYRQLVDLYKVPPTKCICFSAEYKMLPGDIALEPRPNGDYVDYINRRINDTALYI